jgi:hypothetical protein
MAKPRAEDGEVRNQPVPKTQEPDPDDQDTDDQAEPRDQGRRRRRRGMTALATDPLATETAERKAADAALDKRLTAVEAKVGITPPVVEPPIQPPIVVPPSPASTEPASWATAGRTSRSAGQPQAVSYRFRSRSGARSASGCRARRPGLLRRQRRRDQCTLGATPAGSRTAPCSPPSRGARQPEERRWHDPSGSLDASHVHGAGEPHARRAVHLRFENVAADPVITHR